MAILRDYKCPEHGLFESFEQRCPESGCEHPISIAHLKPVGIKSAKTAGFDNAIRAQADAFGMTDLRSAREGDNQLGYLPNPTGGADTPPPGSGVLWGGVPQELAGQNAAAFNVEAIVKGRVFSKEDSTPRPELGFEGVRARTQIVADDPTLRVPMAVANQP